MGQGGRKGQAEGKETTTNQEMSISIETQRRSAGFKGYKDDEGRASSLRLGNHEQGIQGNSANGVSR